MAGAHRHAEFAVGLEAADARAVAGARVDHHERAFLRVDDHPCRRLDPHQPVIDRPREGAAVQHQFVLETEDVRHRLGFLRVVLVAALAQHVPEQNGALPAIDPVIHRLLGDERASGGWGGERGEGLGLVGHRSNSSGLGYSFPEDRRAAAITAGYDDDLACSAIPRQAAHPPDGFRGGRLSAPDAGSERGAPRVQVGRGPFPAAS